MNSIQKTAIGFLGAAALMLAVATPALALDTSSAGGAAIGVSATGVGVSATANAKLQTRITTAKGRADQEIDRRNTALNDLNTRVQAMARLSADQKSTIAASIASQVSVLTALKTKIDADTDIATLKTDIKSIAASYRIFMLVIPQGRIEVAADKMNTVSTSLSTFAGKLQSAIASAQASGKDVTAVNASLAEMNAKIADANTQSSAAVSLVATLTPDNGDKTKQAANDQALKTARADIKLAAQDVETARKDAHSIVQALHGMGIGASAGARATTKGSATTQ